LDGDNWLGVSQDTDHILLQTKLRQRFTATTIDEAQVGSDGLVLFAIIDLTHT
jgi:hypothetical protein